MSWGRARDEDQVVTPQEEGFLFEGRGDQWGPPSSSRRISPASGGTGQKDTCRATLSPVPALRVWAKLRAQSRLLLYLGLPPVHLSRAPRSPPTWPCHPVPIPHVASAQGPAGARGFLTWGHPGLACRQVWPCALGLVSPAPTAPPPPQPGVLSWTMEKIFNSTF